MNRQSLHLPTVQWGYNGASVATIVLPVAFKTTTYSVVAASKVTAYAMNLASRSLASFVIGNYQNNYSCYWLAVGY